MTWTVTQKLGAQASHSFDLQKVIKSLAVFPRELCTAFFLVGAGIYGYHVGTSWVFTVYFCAQGLIFLIFSLSLVEAFNLQPPPEAQLLGLPPKSAEIEMAPVAKPSKKKRSKKARERRKQGAKYSLAGADSEDTDSHDDSDEAEAASLKSSRAPPPPSLYTVLRANVIIFLYTLPVNLFSIVLLYGVTTMALSEMLNTQWDDLIALTLALFLVPGHMCWCLGNPELNWRERKLARQGKLPMSSKLRQAAQLGILYFLLSLLFLVSMYSCSATLQDYVSREVYHLTGKWLEEYIDRR